MQQAASTVKKVALELGGNAPFIVFDDADLDAAVEGAVASKFRNMGQTCVCTNRIYVQAGIHDRFIERLREKVQQLSVGDGFAHGVVQGPLITQAAVAKVEAHIFVAVAKGAEIVAGGQRMSWDTRFFSRPFSSGRTQPCSWRGKKPLVFWPRSLNLTPKTKWLPPPMIARGLGRLCLTRDVGRVFRVMEDLEYGMVGVNTGIMSSELAPFGGIKKAGIPVRVHITAFWSSPNSNTAALPDCKLESQHRPT